MKLDLNKEEIISLAKSVFIAAWVAESSDHSGKEGIMALEQKLYHLIHEQGPKGLVEYDEELKLHFIAPDKEEEWVEDYIAPHDDEHLWESLQMELARRDLAKDHSSAQITAMTEDERIEKLSQALRRYSEEFASSGLENLYIKKD